uniref:Reverse transcriptase Ty1/copia-type domain-containing protein n=1 Tax=Cannabis sativa TaxID=3483 RepID=A0A803NI42_CANSA
MVDLPDPHTATANFNLHPMITRSKSGIRKPYLFYSVVAGIPIEPSSFWEASVDPKWNSAIYTETIAWSKKHTLILVLPPPNCKVIKCKWVYRIKLNSDGTVERYKACLVAKKFHQTQGLDYNETLSPVIKPNSTLLVLSLAVSYDLTIKELDIQNAFSHGDLTETVYMAQTEGFFDPLHPHRVYKLSKSLYGLKQSPWACLVRALQYCTLIDPDIALTVNKLCQFLHALTTVHHQAANLFFGTSKVLLILVLFFNLIPIFFSNASPMSIGLHVLMIVVALMLIMFS